MVFDMAKKDAEKLTKITAVLPEALLERAQDVTGSGITQTIRLGLELVAARKAYDEIREARGTYKSALDLDELRRD